MQLKVVLGILQVPLLQRHLSRNLALLKLTTKNWSCSRTQLKNGLEQLWNFSITLAHVTGPKYKAVRLRRG